MPDKDTVGAQRDLTNPYIWEHDEVEVRDPNPATKSYKCPDCGVRWRESLSPENSTCPPNGGVQG